MGRRRARKLKHLLLLFRIFILIKVIFLHFLRIVGEDIFSEMMFKFFVNNPLDIFFSQGILRFVKRL